MSHAHATHAHQLPFWAINGKFFNCSHSTEKLQTIRRISNTPEVANIRMSSNSNFVASLLISFIMLFVKLMNVLHLLVFITYMNKILYTLISTALQRIQFVVFWASEGTSNKASMPPMLAPTNNILVTYGALQVLYCIVLYCQMAGWVNSQCL